MRYALENAAFRVMEAGDADDANKLLSDEYPDLILLDWMLPGRSGLELAQQLKQSPKTCGMPIMISARGEEEDRVKGLDTDVDDYIAKPFSPREMVARIKTVLRRSRPDEIADTLINPGLDRFIDAGEHMRPMTSRQSTTPPSCSRCGSRLLVRARNNAWWSGETSPRSTI